MISVAQSGIHYIATTESKYQLRKTYKIVLEEAGHFESFHI